MTISRAQVYSLSRSRVFLKLTVDQVLVFDWITGSCQGLRQDRANYCALIAIVQPCMMIKAKKTGGVILSVTQNLTCELP